MMTREEKIADRKRWLAWAEEQLAMTERELADMDRDVWPPGVYRNEGYRQTMQVQRKRLNREIAGVRRLPAL